MSGLFYYYILEVNTNNKYIKEHYSDVFNEFGYPNSVVLSSKEFSDYQVCLDTVAEIISSNVRMIKEKTPVNIKSFWEKNTFETVEAHDDWMMNEAAKMYIMDEDGSGGANDVLMKCRIFFKEPFLVHSAPEAQQ